MSDEELQSCVVCDSTIDENEDVCIISRSRPDGNVKFFTQLCHKCYLEDEDFCVFMNKINCRVR